MKRMQLNIYFKTFICAASCISLALTTSAQGNHTAQVNTDTPKVDSVLAHETGDLGAYALSHEAIDGTNLSGYRYFGQLAGGYDFSEENAIANFSAQTDITNLNANDHYIILLTQAATVEGPGAASITITWGSSSFAIAYDENGETPAGTAPDYILNNITSISVLINGTIDNTGADTCVIDASASLSVVEIVTNTAYHEDCDVDNDGDLDADDIDLLYLAIESEAFDTVTNSNAIAMFNVDGDINGNIDQDDVNELVTGAFCLDTFFGDTDLDGDVDDTDLGTAFSNYTGPVGRAGGKGWADGDTDGDGDVDDTDLGTMFFYYTE